MNEADEMAAMTAYTNCLGLLDEANILYRHSKFPRAYALCILSAEEFAKAYVYKRSSVGLDPNNEGIKKLRDHKKKILVLIPVLLNAYIFSKFGTNILGAIQHDNRQSNSQKKLAPAVIQEAIILGMNSQPIIRIFWNAHYLKLKALYVDVVDGQLSDRSEVIGDRLCKDALDCMNECIHGFDLLLKCDDETFHKVRKWLDPLDCGFDQRLQNHLLQLSGDQPVL